MGYSPEYYKANKAKFRAWHYKWKVKNRDKHLAYRLKWNRDHRSQLRDKGKEYYKMHRERRVAEAAEWNRNNRGRIKARPNYYLSCRKQNLRKCHNLTLEEFDKLKAGQNGLCASCGRPPKEGKVLHVDHNHRTDKRRGLLCNYCNMVVGIVESPGLIDKIKAYLEKYDG